MPTPTAKKVGSLAALKAQLKKSSGQGGFIRYIPKSPGVLMVRFLTEPDEFYVYEECWSQAGRTSFPYVEGMQEGIDFDRKSTVYLANALDVDNDKVIPLQLKTTVLNSLVIRFDRYGTLLDRDYEIARYGEGLDTTYEVTPEAPQNRKLDKYTVLDLEDVINQAAEDRVDNSKTAAKKKAPAASGSGGERRRKPIPRGSRTRTEEESTAERYPYGNPSANEMLDMDWTKLRKYARWLGITDPATVRSKLIAQVEEQRF
jgi:hypothetical protein